MAVGVCKRGHEMAPANRVPRVTKKGTRYDACRACLNAQQRARYVPAPRAVVHGCGYCGVGSGRLVGGLCPDCVSVHALVRQLDMEEAA